jgi:hypothetical protein
MAERAAGGALPSKVRIVLRASPPPRIRIVLRRPAIRIVLRGWSVDVSPERWRTVWNTLTAVEQLAAWNAVFHGKPQREVVQAIVDAYEATEES